MTLGLATRLLTIAIGIKTTAIGIAWYLNPAVNGALLSLYGFLVFSVAILYGDPFYLPV